MERLGAEDVIRIARQGAAAPPCDDCAAFVCPGWESFPAAASESALQRLGTLWLPDDPEPTLAEHHPAGTRYWSPDAPIALAYHPANRCSVWACRACGRAFLRYTEYGGYYEDRRIRELNPALIVSGVPGAV
jgi:hypothetical protein